MKRKLSAILVLSMIFGSFGGAATSAAPKSPTTSVSWTGQGTAITDGARDFNTSICGTDNGAPVDGYYVQFVLASTKTINSAKIKFGTDTAINMDKSNLDKKGASSYKYIYTGDLTLGELLSLPVVSEYSGTGTPTLTVSHGCVPDPSPNMCAVDPFDGLSNGYTYLETLGEGDYAANANFTLNGASQDLYEFIAGMGGEEFAFYGAFLGCVSITGTIGAYVSDTNSNVIYSINQNTYSGNPFINAYPFMSNGSAIAEYNGEFPYLRIIGGTSPMDEGKQIVYTIKWYPTGAYGVETPHTYTFAYLES